MYEYKILGLALSLSVLQRMATDALHADRAGKQVCDNVSQKENTADCVEAAVGVLSALQADSSLIAQMEQLKNNLRSQTWECRPGILNALLQQIITGIQATVSHRMFMYVAVEDSVYWNNFQWFGPKYIVVFPLDAVFEAAEAQNCFALSRYTASVFHSMRVAEYALRRLAGLVGGVKLTDKGKLIPIEYATWDKVIQAVRTKIAKARTLPIGPKKETRLQFYSSAADQCEYMKDIWRNETAHTRRRSYKREETLGILARVREFARLLAEHECTPKKEQELLARKMLELQELYPKGKVEQSHETDKERGTETVRSSS